MDDNGRLLKREVESGGNSGIHILVSKSLDELNQLVKDGGALVADDTLVCPMQSFESMKSWIPYGLADSSGKNIIQSYQDNERLGSCTSTSVCFDMVHDFGTPCQDFIPFMFFERIKSK